jgi:transposase
VSQLPSSTFVLTDPIEIVGALVGLKEVRVLAYTRNGPDVELVIEQVVGQIRCPACGERAQVKERPVVRYVDLPVYGTPMSLAWKKHRMRYANASCPKRSWMLGDHRIAAKNCLLTTRAAKWATLQVGTGRTVKEVAGELACDWHTVNDAVTTYGKALLEADRKRMNKTSAIGLDETKFVKLGPHAHSDYATTVVDVEHHQIIDVLPSRTYVDVAAWLDKQPKAWKERIDFEALDMSDTYAAVYSVVLPKAHQVVDAFHAVSLANRCLDRGAPAGPKRADRAPRTQRRSPLSSTARAAARRRDSRRQSHGAPVVVVRARRPRSRSGHRLSDQRAPPRFLCDL